MGFLLGGFAFLLFLAGGLALGYLLCGRLEGILRWIGTVVAGFVIAGGGLAAMTKVLGGPNGEVPVADRLCAAGGLIGAFALGAAIWRGTEGAFGVILTLLGGSGILMAGSDLPKLWTARAGWNARPRFSPARRAVATFAIPIFFALLAAPNWLSAGEDEDLFGFSRPSYESSEGPETRSMRRGRMLENLFRAAFSAHFLVSFAGALALSAPALWQFVRAIENDEFGDQNDGLYGLACGASIAAIVGWLAS